jgi:3-oxoacyl-[acyl-carrier-protein] synthase III
VAVIRSVIRSVGAHLPKRVMTNADLAKLVDTSDEWIVERTGIRQRHIAGDDELTSDLGIAAAKQALVRAGLDPVDVDLVICATATPDRTFPATAVKIQHGLGVSKGAAFDVQAVCSGFVYAITIADNFLKTGQFKRAVVIGAETFSRILDWEDRSTCVLFGDGAGAVVVGPASEDGFGILDFEHHVDGSGGPALCMPAGGSRMPASHDTVDQRLHYVKQEGATVFKFAVTKTGEMCERLLSRNNLTAGDIDLFVSHQANRRIIMSAAERLGLPEEKVVINIERFGNTTAATIPLALNDAVNDGRIKRGDRVLLASVGAGFTVGAVLMRWGI